MFYYLLQDGWPQIKYITFRSASAAIVAFVACLLIGKPVIAWLTRKKIGERTDKGDSRVLSEIHRAKAATPTMGGFFVLIAVLLTTLGFAKLFNPFVLATLYVVITLGIVGFYDDYIKLTAVRKKGLSIRMKLLFQVAIGGIVGFELWLYGRDVMPDVTTLYVPFLKETVDLGWLYPVFVTLVIVASSNAVNITDGLDGLAAGCLIIATMTYGAITYLAGRVDFSKYLGIPYVAGVGELTVVCAAIVGAVMGFLWFNAFPAQVFLGNTGALPLGGALGIIAVCAKQELALFLVGAIFVIDTLSVIIQIITVRGWNYRFFKIAPLHHHYQFLGLHETKITIRFWIVAAIFAVIALASLKVG